MKTEAKVKGVSNIYATPKLQKSNAIKINVGLKVDQPYKIAAKTVLVSKKKNQLSDSHAKEFRYASSDESIATVSDTGLINGRKPGKVTIWVYARNGYGKKISVTVK